jgi:uncharacterized membrane protein YjdF
MKQKHKIDKLKVPNHKKAINKANDPTNIKDLHNIKDLQNQSKNYHFFLLISFLLILLWSGINPHNYFVWFLDVIPAVIGVIILLATYKKFKFSDITYTFIFIQATILCIGGHTTYTEVPLFNWLTDTFFLQRNYSDRVGHFFQGFTPALIVYEIILRKKIFQKLIPFVVMHMSCDKCNIRIN